ncbi:MAG: acyltransferase [Bacteroidaceae bacterium]|nr:acyltransferase [Bacteroidaceae bacterium]
MQNQRIVFLDYVRVFACFLVILVHASENFYASDASGLGGPVSLLLNEQNRLWVSVYDGFSRMSVPLFMIISAYLLAPMPEGQSMLSFYKRRALRILPPVIFFMLLYTFLPLLWNGMSWEQSWTDLRNLPLNFPSMAGHLWFIYPLISLYLIIPVISPWLEKASAKEELVFVGLFVLSTFMPYMHRWLWPELWGECFWNEFHMLWYCSGFLGYLVLAHYIRKHLRWNIRKRVWVGVVSVLVGAFFTMFPFYYQGVPGRVIATPVLEVAWAFCTPNVVLLTFGAFILFSCIRTLRAPAWLTAVSRLSFGIYLMHLFFLNMWAQWLVNGNPAEPLLPVAVTIPLMAVLTFVTCVVVARLVSFLPGSKWVIGA